MITLFRRIRQKLIDSGSVTKYLLYAVGEILLVVVGILIALQVNNWNEGRKEQQQEQEYLMQLLDDARADSVFFESRVALLNRNSNGWNQVRVDGNNTWEDSVHAAISDSIYSFYFRVVHDSFLIKNNPDPFLVVQDPELKETLREYQNAHNYVSIATELLNRIVEEHGVPLELKYARQLQAIQNGSFQNTGDIGFFRNEDIQSALRLFSSLSDNALGTLPLFLETNAKLIDQLDHELN